PFLPPLPGFFKKKSSRGTAARGVDLEAGSRPYEGLGGDEAWDAREEYEGARLHTGGGARGFDGQGERRYDDEEEEGGLERRGEGGKEEGGGGGGLENGWGGGATRSKGGENPFGSGARRVEEDGG